MMTEEVDVVKELVSLTDLRSTSRLLVIGNGQVPDLKDRVASVKVAKKPGDLNKLLASEPPETFDRVFVLANNTITSQLIDRACQSVAVGGLLVFFSVDTDIVSIIEDHLDANYPNHNTWQLDTVVGQYVVTDARGIPASIWASAH
jgi:hypothetical protein